MFIKSAFTLSILFGFVSSHFLIHVDEDSLKELKCFPPPPPEEVGMDLEWFGTLKKVYVPLWNKLYAVRTAADLFGKEPNELLHHELGPSSCLINTGNNITGWGRAVTLDLTADATAISFKAPRKGAKAAKFQFHMTDNKSFILGIACWEDDQSTWAVMSTNPYLDAVTKSKILNYVQTKGFKLEYSAEEDYGYCPESYHQRQTYVQYVPVYPQHFGNFFYKK